MPKGIGYGKAARAKVSPEKAKKILHDGSVNGQKLSDKQRKFFGAVAGRAKMHKAAEGTGITEGIKDAESTSIPPQPFNSSARQNILEGMQDGGAASLMSLAAVLNSLDPVERQNRLNAMTLGLQSARRNRDPYSIEPISPDLLVQEVTRAYQAILQQAQGPGGQMTPTPTPLSTQTPGAIPTQTPTPSPIPVR